MAKLLTKDKLGKRSLSDNSSKWVYATCPYCGKKYGYVENGLYRPKTCNKYQCVRASLHPNIGLR